jgi:hypothetical protein
MAFDEIIAQTKKIFRGQKPLGMTERCHSEPSGEESFVQFIISNLLCSSPLYFW